MSIVFIAAPAVAQDGTGSLSGVVTIIGEDEITDGEVVVSLAGTNQSVATTVVSFLPVFVMTGAEGKLFKPLAFTKTFALIAAVVLALTFLPVAAQVLIARRSTRGPSWWGAGPRTPISTETATWTS